MTREEAIAFFKDMNECTYGNLEAVDMAIKALEQKSILDKIRAEIEQAEIGDYIRDVECFRAGLNRALNIIDKYKAESEE